MKRLVGIGSVWVGCCIAWVVLGSTLLVRSDDSSLTGQGDVHQLWGPPTEQRQPAATSERITYAEEPSTVVGADGVSRSTVRSRRSVEQVSIPVVRSEVEVDLALEHRRRGLQWYPTYTVDLEGRYTFQNTTGEAREVSVVFPLSTSISSSSGWTRPSYGSGTTAAFDNFVVRDSNGEAVAFEIVGDEARWTAHLEAGERRAFTVQYRGRGTERWQYRMAEGASRVDNFRLVVRTDFADVDFPSGTLSPTEHAVDGGRWEGTWSFESSIANRPIGVQMPQRINPGPLAARITFFAPVGLLFFFFVVGILAMSKSQDLHPMHYFFLGCSFFAFHLLFAYLVDHLSIMASFAVSAAVSMTLAVSYARLFTGLKFALLQVGVSQLLYLVLFSATFLWDGFTGLAITVGAIVTLFVMMQITGRRAWGRAPEQVNPDEVDPELTTLPSADEAILDTTPSAF